MKPINTTNNTKNNRSPYNNRQYDNHHQQRLIANSSDISKSNRSTKSSVEMRRNWSSKLFPSLKFCNLFLPIICITSSIVNLILIHQLYRFVERVKLDIEHTMSTAQGYVILESNQTHVALSKHRVPRSLDQEIDIPQFEQSNTEQQQVKLGQFIIPVQVPVEVISTFCQESENYCRRNHAMLKGEKGECGEAGPKGEPGLRGPMGATGFPGVNGEKGDKGDRGERGYIGFPGAQGPPGQAGPHGQMGYTGLSGPQGLPGHPGLMGKVGPKGEKGDRGPQGLRGTKGMKADPGISRKHPNVPSQNIVPQTRSSMKKREKECLLDWIGIPILVREMKINNSIIKYGAWMKDQLPKTGDQQKYVYVTVNNQGNKIYEYENEKSISKRGKWRRVIELPVGYEYYGCGHIIVHGNFIFHRANTSTIVSANINIGTNNDTVAEIVAERNIFDEPWVSDNKRRLYQDPKIGCFDFALYDGSIWVTFKEASGDSDRLVVLKLARDTLEFRGVRYDIAIEPTILVNTFLAYGMLYGVHSYDDHTTYVQLAFDVVEGKTLTTVDLKLTVPYKSLAQLSYDPYTRRLYAWDDGRLIYYMYNVKASQSKC